MSNNNTERRPRRDETFDQRRDAFFLSRWFSLHTFRLLYRSFKDPLKSTDVLACIGSDMFNLPEELYPEKNAELFRQTERQMPVTSWVTQGSSLRMILLRGVLWDMLLTGAILTIISGVLTLSGPLAVRYILVFLMDHHVTVAKQREIAQTVSIWIVIYFFKIFLNQLAERQFILASVRTEQTLTVLLHEKIIQLPLTYRLNMKKGTLYALLNNEIRAIAAFVLAASSIFSTPACLIAIQILVLVQFKLYGLVVLAVIVFGIIYLIVLAKMMHAKRWRKIELQSIRMGFNVEMISSMRDLKLLGWDQHFVNRNVESRKYEIEEAKDYYFLMNMWDLFISMAPMFIVLVIEGFKKVTTKHTLDLPAIYLILSYIGMIYIPSKAFLIAYVKGLEASKALTLLDALFKMENISIQPTKTTLLNPGDVTIKNLVATSLDTNQTYREMALNQTNDLSSLQTKQQHNQLGKKTKYAFIQVPMEVRLSKGDRLLLLSDSNGGKSSFVRAIMGQLKIKKGVACYNGKIAYVSHKLWFRKKTIRENVLFGEPLKQSKLDRVYKLCGLDAHLRGLPKGDATVIEPNCGWSSARKLKIALARILYCEPDIVFMDQPFGSIDPQTAQIMYDHIRRIFAQSTLIISTQVTSFIHPDDLVLLLHEREAVQLGRFGDMLRDYGGSYLNRMLPSDNFEDLELGHHKKSTSQDQQFRRQEERLVRQRKIKTFLRCMVQIARNHPEEIDSFIRKRSSVYQQPKAPVDNTGKRQPMVTWEFYKKFFVGAPVWWFIGVYLMMVLGQASRVFSEWWLGLAKYNPYYLSSYQALAIYIASAIACGLLLAVVGSVSPAISGRVTKTVTTTLSQQMASSSFEFFEQENPLKVAVKINRDIEEFFLANNYIQSILRNLLHFLATVILLVLRSPILFLLLALFIVLTNLGILKVYINADRELFSFRQVNIEAMANAYEEAINGIDIFRTFGKIHILREDAVRISYRISVQAVNYRFAAQAMTILCEISGLVILAAAAFFAISHKFKVRQQDIAVIGTAISFALRMSFNISQVVRDSTRTDNLMKLCVRQKNSYEIIGKNQQKLFKQPIPPENWPADSSLEMTSVNLQYESMKRPAVKDINLKVDSGSRIAICGKGGSGKGTVLAGLARALLPSNQPIGIIKVGGIDTKLIGRKYYSEKVVMLSAFPLIFTASLRQNLDPFDKHTDAEIRSALQTVELWNELQLDDFYKGTSQTQGKLSIRLTDGGAQLTLNQQQRLNIARVLLIKPMLLITDNFTSSLDVIMKEKLLAAVEAALRTSTIVVIPESAKIAMNCDWVMYLSRGTIKEQGEPKQLLAKNQSFAKLVKSGSRFRDMLMNRPVIESRNDDHQEEEPRSA